MHPQAILDDLAACGIAPRLTPDGCGIALPAGQLSPAQRAAITANKAALIVFLQAVDQAPPTPKKPLALDPGERALLALASTRPPAPAKPLPHFHLDQPWRVADRLYQAHHWQCTVCKAAARAAPGTADRCAAGQLLHDAYTSKGHHRD